MDVASRIMSLTSYSYKSYNTTCNPYQFKIAHDISVENFQTFQEELADASPTKSIRPSGDNDFINHSDPVAVPGPPLESVDVLNQKNAAHSSLSNDPGRQESPTVLNKSGVNGLRIEDVEKIGTDLIRLHIDRKDFCHSDSVVDGPALLRKDEVTRSRSPVEFDTSSPRQSNKFSSFKKRRKPRKLPEIPVGCQRKSLPAKVQLKELINVSSLAEELSAADPTVARDLPIKSSYGASYGANGFLYNGTQECAVDLKELGSPESVTQLPVTLHVTPVIITRTQSQSTEEHDSNCDKSCCDRSDSMQSSVQTDNSEEFADLTEYFEDITVGTAGEPSRNLEDQMPQGFNTTSDASRAYLSATNQYLLEDSSPEDKRHTKSGLKVGKKDTAEGSQAPGSTEPALFDDLDASHRGCHKFIPRHTDELFIEIGDPIYVEVEADDLWCEGVNIRTGKRGIFPAAYATDLGFLEDNDGTKAYKVNLKFLGSIEVSYHKGYDVLCQAINKVAQTRRMTLITAPPPVCCLEINEYGIKMTDKSKKRKNPETSMSPKKGSFTQRLVKMLSASRDKESKNDHFFSLKNVSFCGYHPKNDKYFAFITKHPLEMRFACHVFYADKSTKCVTEAVGSAFKKFYQEYMAFVHPTEDIYLE